MDLSIKIAKWVPDEQDWYSLNETQVGSLLINIIKSKH